MRFGFDSHEELFARQRLEACVCLRVQILPCLTHETRASAPYRESMMAAIDEPFTGSWKPYVCVTNDDNLWGRPRAGLVTISVGFHDTPPDLRRYISE